MSQIHLTLYKPYHSSSLLFQKKKHHSSTSHFDICVCVCQGTKAIKGIIAKYSTRLLEDANGISFTAEAFKSMSKLRILYLNNVNISGSFEDTFEDLRWLFWRNCPLKFFPSGFYPINLVTLELPMSKMRTDWELNIYGWYYPCISYTHTHAHAHAHTHTHT